MAKLVMLYALVIALLLMQAFIVRVSDKRVTTYVRQVNLMKHIARNVGGNSP